MLLARDRSLLLVVDAQARLVPAIHEAGQALERIGVLIAAAKHLGVPTRATEQYPKGLGATVPEVAARLDGAPVHEKLAFGAMAEPAFRATMLGEHAKGRDIAVLCGFEAHVCVLQTAMGLLDAGFRVALVADAVSSRRRESVDVALRRLERTGADVVTTEMVVFEWLERAGTDMFRAVSTLVK